MTIDVLSPKLKEYATPRQCEYIDAVLRHGSNSKAATELGVGRRTVDRAINAAKRAAIDAGGIVPASTTPRVLVMDIETAPCRSYIWSIWSETRSTELMISDWYILTWAAKWLGDDDVMSMSLFDTKGYKPGTENDKALLEGMHSLMDEADYIITHNGDKFDIKKINTRFLEHGINPPTPYKSIDTLKIAKRYFSFTSNKLDYIAQKVLGDQKLKHDGFSLWSACVDGVAEAWEVMLRYNIKDVDLLERVYIKLRAWDHLHPNFAVHTDSDQLCCTVCGSTNVVPTGDTVKTTTGAYLGYVCREAGCGHQMRGETNIRSYTQARSTLRNAK